jgi:hypothetical protein
MIYEFNFYIFLKKNNMKNIWIFLLGLTIVLTCCKKEEKDTENETDQYSNKITLGTGMSGFNITGEATTFYLIGGSLNIYWRLESKDDMAGSQVRILISKSISSTYQTIDTIDYNNPQSYGHIMLSSYPHTYGAGSFKATGILLTGSKTIASKEYIVN